VADAAIGTRTRQPFLSCNVDLQTTRTLFSKTPLSEDAQPDSSGTAHCSTIIFGLIRTAVNFIPFCLFSFIKNLSADLFISCKSWIGGEFFSPADVAPEIMIPTNINKIFIIVFAQLVYGGLKYEAQQLSLR
jgi:hypothetical protein